jgi:hypothetical protein
MLGTTITIHIKSRGSTFEAWTFGGMHEYQPCVTLDQLHTWVSSMLVRYLDGTWFDIAGTRVANAIEFVSDDDIPCDVALLALGL